MQSEWLLNTIYLNEAEKEKIPLLKSVICYKIIALSGIIFYFKRNEFLKGENLAVSLTLLCCLKEAASGLRQTVLLLYLPLVTQDVTYFSLLNMGTRLYCLVICYSKNF